MGLESISFSREVKKYDFDLVQVAHIHVTSWLKQQKLEKQFTVRAANLIGAPCIELHKIGTMFRATIPLEPFYKEAEGKILQNTNSSMINIDSLESEYVLNVIDYVEKFTQR